MTERSDIQYEIIISPLGAATLTCGGEVMWTSDGDTDFAETMDEVIDFEDDAQIDALIEWLVDHDYIPPDVDVDILPEEDATL